MGGLAVVDHEPVLASDDVVAVLDPEEAVSLGVVEGVLGFSPLDHESVQAEAGLSEPFLGFHDDEGFEEDGDVYFFECFLSWESFGYCVAYPATSVERIECFATCLAAKALGVEYSEIEFFSGGFGLASAAGTGHFTCSHGGFY